MKNLFKDKTFVTGLLIGIVIIILLNICLPIQKLNFDNFLSYYGFPFAFYRVGYIQEVEQIREILWLGLGGDLLFGLLISSLAGISVKFLADNKLNLK